NLSQFYVDLSTAQLIGGAKTFSNAITFNSPIIGNLNGNATTAGSAATAGDAALFSGKAPSAFAQIGLPNTFVAGNRQTFASDATNASLNIATFSFDPSNKMAGDLWFTGSRLKLQVGNTTPKTLAFLDDITSAGTVTNVATGAGLMGGPITTSGTIS